MAAIDMHHKFALLVCISMAKLRRRPLQHIIINTTILISDIIGTINLVDQIKFMRQII